MIAKKGQSGTGTGTHTGTGLKKTIGHGFGGNLDKEKKPSTFVAEIDIALATKLRADLMEQGFTLSQMPYTLFSAKKKGISCTLYTSGKLVVQGAEMASFIEFYLEPEILKSFAFTYQEEADETIDLTPRIGADEAGKGDFFGPLCIAVLYADAEGIKKLKPLGVKDSKKLTDPKVLEIARKLRTNYAHHIVKINPAKYNEIYLQFHNLNRLLAWGHATAIEQLINQTNCKTVIIDKFADDMVMKRALQKKNVELMLTQRHHAEADLVVAAASILARSTFLEGLKKMEEEFGMEFPKGASQQVITAAKQFVRKYGAEALSKVGKLHFKTLDSILRTSEDD